MKGLEWPGRFPHSMALAWPGRMSNCWLSGRRRRRATGDADVLLADIKSTQQIEAASWQRCQLATAAKCHFHWRQFGGLATAHAKRHRVHKRPFRCQLQLMSSISDKLTRCVKLSRSLGMREIVEKLFSPHAAPKTLLSEEGHVLHVLHVYTSMLPRHLLSLGFRKPSDRRCLRGSTTWAELHHTHVCMTWPTSDQAFGVSSRTSGIPEIGQETPNAWTCTTAPALEPNGFNGNIIFN
eukprot:363032-Chlamydomonas_euryale.AAC.2